MEPMTTRKDQMEKVARARNLCWKSSRFNRVSQQERPLQQHKRPRQETKLPKARPMVRQLAVVQDQPRLLAIVLMVNLV